MLLHTLMLLLLGSAFESSSAATSDPTLEIECGDESMTVILKKADLTGLDTSTLSLKDVTCKNHVENGTHIIVNAPFDGCMTTHNTSRDTIIYYNTIRAEARSSGQNSSISREFKAEYPFQCTYSRTRILSVVSFSPREKVIYTRSGQFGNFTYLMDIYQTDRYEEPYSSYPVTIDLSATMYIQVEVRSNDSQLALFLEKCWATPTSDPDSANEYSFITEGCAGDDTMVYDYEEGAVQRFSIDAFRFVQQQSEVVHLHCKVEACRMGNNLTKCARGCSNEQRKRRSLELDAAEGEVVSLGPFVVVTTNNAQSAAGSATSVTTVASIAGVLALLVLVLFVTLLVIYKKRQPAPAPHVVYSKAGSDDTNHLV